MIKSTITLQVTLDEETLKEKYPNYKTNWESLDAFVVSLIQGFETPIELEGKPINYLKEYGYEVAVMDKKEGPWEQS